MVRLKRNAILLLLLLLAAGFFVALPRVARAQSTGIEVFALQGSLRQAVGQPFTTYLVVDSDGRTFGLFGRTPEVDRQIEAFRAQGLDVKVWGVLYMQGRISDLPELVVDTVTAASVPSTPTATPAAGVPITVNAQSINVRSGPGTAYPPVGALQLGATCRALARNGDASWLRLTCPAVTGWVLTALLTVQGNAVNLPVVAVGPPPATPTPPAPPQLPAAFPNWMASYYGNRNLSGAPLVVRNEPNAVLDWGAGSPDPRIPVDNFSLRAERNLQFASQLYRVSVTVDDGVRLWLNNVLVIDDWREGAERTLTVERRLSGWVNMRVEYFDAYGFAKMILRIEPASQPPQPTRVPGQNEVPVQVGRWSAAYWNNRTFTGLPLVARYENRSPYPLDKNWGNGSPVAGIIGGDAYAARWRGMFNFAQGDHTFRATADDGVRVRIDGIIIIDGWYDGYKSLTNTFKQVGAGNHTITVEFYENAGTSFVQVLWYRETYGDNSDGGGAYIRDE